MYATALMPGSTGYRRVVISLFGAGVATFALLYSPQAILPTLANRFSVSTTAATLSLSVTTLAMAATLLVAAPLSDVFGRTRLIKASMVLSSVFALGVALAPNWPVLLTCRALLGVALAGLPAVATAYLREELHASSQARAVGQYIGGTAIGGMTGRMLTGFTADLAGWRWALAAVALLGALCAVVVWRLLPESRNFRRTAADPATLRRRAGRALADRALIALYLVSCCAMGAMVAVLNAIGFRLESAAFGLSVGAASLVFLVYPLGSASSALFGRLADAVGRRAVLPIGAGIAIVGSLVTMSGNLLWVVVGLSVLVIGFFCIHSIASGWVPVRADLGGASAAQAAAFYTCTYYLGSSLFGSLGATAWTALGWSGVAGLATVLFAAAGLLSLFLRTTRSLAT